MTKTSNTNNQNAVLIMNAEPKEIMQLHQDMSDWFRIEAPESRPFKKETKPVSQAFQAIMAFAKQVAEARVLAIFKHICEKQLLDEIPLLVAGSKHPMSLGQTVK